MKKSLGYNELKILVRIKIVKEEYMFEVDKTYLNSFSQIVTFPFLIDDMLIDFPGCNIVISMKSNV